jgi:RNA polymerase sigma-70 factor (ECF subfamily)
MRPQLRSVPRDPLGSSASAGSGARPSVGSGRDAASVAAREAADTRLVEGLREGRAWAQRALLEEHTGLVERVLLRILGRFNDLDDLVQDVFVRVLDRVDEIREPAALRGFIAQVAVFVAREAIRKKRRKRWLVFGGPDETPEPVAEGVDEEARAALGELYDVLDKLDEDTRIAFTLRYIDGMEVADVGQACGVSLSTIKRRLRESEARVGELAMNRPTLARFVAEGGRWAAPADAQAHGGGGA